MSATKKGPAKKPTEAKRRTGNPGKRPLPDLATVVQLDVPPEPPTPLRPLLPPGQTSWDRAWVAGRFWLAPSDVEAVQYYCEAVDDYILLRQQLMSDLATIGEGAPGLWRMRKQLLDYRMQMRTFASDLGLTPVARSELGVAEVRIAQGAADLMERAEGGTAPTLTIE